VPTATPVPTPTSTPLPTVTPTPVPTFTATATPDLRKEDINLYIAIDENFLRWNNDLGKQTLAIMERSNDAATPDWIEDRQRLEDQFAQLITQWDNTKPPSGFEGYHAFARLLYANESDIVKAMAEFTATRGDPGRRLDVWHKLDPLINKTTELLDNARTAWDAANKATMPGSSTGLSNSFGDGVHEVGIDIRPGTYRTSNSLNSCYWARLSGFSGELRHIIANDNPTGPAIVTIEITDRGFKSERCGTWTRIGN